MASTSVVFPWSTWAMMATFLSLSFTALLFFIFSYDLMSEQKVMFGHKTAQMQGAEKFSTIAYPTYVEDWKCFCNAADGPFLLKYFFIRKSGKLLRSFKLCCGAHRPRTAHGRYLVPDRKP
jgi:hypothetical protein